jgi:nucleoporin POM152
MDTSKAGVYTYKFNALSDSLYNSNKRKFSPLLVEQTVNAKPSAVFVKPGQAFKYCLAEQDNEEKIPIKLTGVAPFSIEVEIKHQAGATPELYKISSIPTHNYNIQIPRSYLRLGAQHVRIRKVRDGRDCQKETDVGGPSIQLQLYDAPAVYPLESRIDYCVGERIQYTLSGTPPFLVRYTLDGHERTAKVATTNFRRIADAPGVLTVHSVSDKASECRAAVDITKKIHQMPAVRISKGRSSRVDIHEGSEVEILFEFEGTPPFEFTYTRSSNAKKGEKSQVLETRHDVSEDFSKVIKASQEGTYEVVAIKDRHCAFSTQQVQSKGSDKLLT